MLKGFRITEVSITIALFLHHTHFFHIISYRNPNGLSRVLLCDRRQTDGPRYGKMRRYRRNRLRCKKRLRLIIRFTRRQQKDTRTKLKHNVLQSSVWTTLFTLLLLIKNLIRVSTQCNARKKVRNRRSSQLSQQPKRATYVICVTSCRHIRCIRLGWKLRFYVCVRWSEPFKLLFLASYTLHRTLISRAFAVQCHRFGRKSKRARMYVKWSCQDGQ